MENWTRGSIIGQGSTATVYLAKTTNSGELFAVKSFNSSNSQQTMQEQEIHSSLNSPFIITYLGSKISYDRSYLFMEYASGGSIADKIIKQNKLDEQKIRYYTYQILSALSYLHKKNILHCDVKPQNVLMDSNNQAKLSDFGCSKYHTNNGDHLHICGTPMYMAPEVARGEEQGFEADVWAVGCTVIEMSTGGVPWSGFSDPVSVLHHVGYSSEVPLFPKWISEQGKDFLSKCLNRDPKERWSVEKLLEHPFVLQRDGFQNDLFWVSPRSVLDHGFWESWSDERMEVLERIGVFDTGEELNWPDWSLDENEWISVRDNGSCEIIASANTSDGALITTGNDYIDTGDDHLLEGSCGERGMTFSFFDYCCNNECESKRKSKSKMNDYSWRYFFGIHLLCYLVIFIR